MLSRKTMFQNSSFLKIGLLSAAAHAVLPVSVLAEAVSSTEENVVLEALCSLCILQPEELRANFA